MEKLDAKKALEGFEKWLRGPMAEPYVYWVGHLCSDRSPMTWINGRLTNRLVPEVDELRRVVWAAHKKGKVYLLQKRLGTDRFAYLAFKRTPSRVNGFGNSVEN